jgi:hypothetical protein
MAPAPAALAIGQVAGPAAGFPGNIGSGFDEDFSYTKNGPKQVRSGGGFSRGGFNRAARPRGAIPLVLTAW